MPRELTPQTRRNLWIVAIFFLIDGVASLVAAALTDPGSSIAFYSLVWGIGNIALGFGPVVSVLIATKVPEGGAELKRQARRE